MGIEQKVIYFEDYVAKRDQEKKTCADLLVSQILSISSYILDLDLRVQRGLNMIKARVEHASGAQFERHFFIEQYESLSQIFTDEYIGQFIDIEECRQVAEAIGDKKFVFMRPRRGEKSDESEVITTTRKEIKLLSKWAQKVEQTSTDLKLSLGFDRHLLNQDNLNNLVEQVNKILHDGRFLPSFKSKFDSLLEILIDPS